MEWEVNAATDDLKRLASKARRDPSFGADLLRHLACDLPENVLLEVATAIPLCGDSRAGARALTVLLEALPQHVRRSFLFSVLTSSREEVARISAHLPTEFHSCALQAISNIAYEPQKWAVLSGLMCALSEGLVPKAAQIGLSMRSPLFCASTLADVALRLRNQERTCLGNDNHDRDGVQDRNMAVDGQKSPPSAAKGKSSWWPSDGN